MTAISYAEATLRAIEAIRRTQRGMGMTGTSLLDDRPTTCERCGADGVEAELLAELGAKRYWRALCPACEGKRRLADQEMLAQQRRMEAYQRQIRIDQIFEQSRIGARFRRSTFDTWIPREGTETAFQASRSFADNWPPKHGIGLVLSGATGSGKSHMAAAIANELVNREVVVVFQSVP